METSDVVPDGDRVAGRQKRSLTDLKAAGNSNPIRNARICAENGAAAEAVKLPVVPALLVRCSICQRANPGLQSVITMPGSGAHQARR